MQNALSIARREFNTYFNSPVAYIVLGVFLVAAASLYFLVIGGGVFVGGRASLRGFFGICPLLFMVVAPAITMRTFAEERKTGTLEVLTTLPVNEHEIVLGKYLGSIGMVLVGIAFTVVFPLSLSTLVAPDFTFDWGPVIGGYVGMVLMTSTFISLGMWASALTKNQIVAFILGLAICFALFIGDSVAFFLPETLGRVVQWMSVSFHFENIARGVIDSRDVLFYLSTTAVGLWLSVAALKSAKQ